MGAGYISSIPGILKLVTLVVGFIVIVIADYAYDNASYTSCRGSGSSRLYCNNDDCPWVWPTYPLILVSIICFVASICWLLFNVLSDVSGTAKTVDFVLHLCGGIVLIIIGFCGIVYAIQAYDAKIYLSGTKCSEIKNESLKEDCSRRRKAIYQPGLFFVASVLVMINGGVYIAAGMKSR